MSEADDSIGIFPKHGSDDKNAGLISDDGLPENAEDNVCIL